MSFLLCVSCGNKTEENNITKSTVALNENLSFAEDNLTKYTPFFWGYTLPNIVGEKFPEANDPNLHPLDLGRKTLFLIVSAEKTNDESLHVLAKKYLDFLLHYPYTLSDSTSTVYCYAFDHKNFVKYNWWSGMANSTIALAFMEGYFAYNDTSYYDCFVRAMNGVTENVSKNGSAVDFEGGAKWYLEYTDANTNNDNAYFVLNGFLYSVLALDIIFEKTGEESYHEYYNNAVDAYFELRNKFYYEDKSWTYYMLNPLTIESPHYNIFDLLLFKSLDIKDLEHKFYDEIKIRQQILFNSYPVSIKTEANKDVCLFSSIGMPHPYWIDVYSIMIRYFKNGKIVKSSVLPGKDFQIPVYQRAFILDSLNFDEFDSLAVFSLYLNDTFNLYKVAKKDLLLVNNDQYSKSDFVLKCQTNAKLINENNVEISGSSSDSAKIVRNTVRICFDESFDINKNKLLGVEINPKGEVQTLMITIIDDKNISASRYYVTTKQDYRNLLLLNKTGFNKIENLNCSAIKEISLDIYVNSGTKNFDITVESILGFENNFQLNNYFKNREFYFPEHEKSGNIY